MHYVVARIDPDIPHSASRLRANAWEGGLALRIGEVMQDEPLAEHVLYALIGNARPPGAVLDHTSTIVDASLNANRPKRPDHAVHLCGG
jgi:hypothetical protein